MRYVFLFLIPALHYFSSVIPAKAGIPLATSTAAQSWIPAFAGITAVKVALENTAMAFALSISNISVHA